MQSACAWGRACPGLRQHPLSAGAASRQAPPTPSLKAHYHRVPDGRLHLASAPCDPSTRRAAGLTPARALPSGATALAESVAPAAAADAALVGGRPRECIELSGLVEALNSADKARKVVALTRIIDQPADLACDTSVEAGPLPQLVDSVTKHLSSWVCGAHDEAALAAEALCSVLAVESGSEELEAAAVRCVRPLLQLLASCPLQGTATPAAFFAASALVRAASWPAAAEEAMQQGAAGVVLRLLQPGQPQLLQVGVFALFKLLNGCSRPAEVHQQLQEAGGMQQLSTSLWGAPGGVAAATGATAEMLFSVLMDMAACPRVQQGAAATGDVGGVVRALQNAPTASGRLQAVLVLCRLTCHSSECQLACLQAGTVATVVALMEAGEGAEKPHAARLAAILAQHPAAHEAFRSANVMRPLVMMLRGSDESGAEQAASVAAVLAHNPAMHGHMLLCQLLPALLPLLDTSSAKAKGYVLSTLLLLAMSDGRHAMHLVRENAVARLVAVAKQEPDTHLVEYAAAVLGQLSRCLQVQPEVVGGGAIPALVGLLRTGSHDARAHAAEALAHLASPTAVRKRLIARAGVLAPLGAMLAQAHPESRYWSSNLLQVLSQEASVLGEMAGQGLCGPLVKLLAARPSYPGDAELLQAQAQACWVMVRLVGHPQAGACRQLKAAGAVPLLMRLVRAVQPSPSSGARVAAQLDALEHNTHAAAMAALLALRGAGVASTMELLQAAAVQHWCGHPVRLHGLTAADHPAGH